MEASHRQRLGSVKTLAWIAGGLLTALAWACSPDDTTTEGPDEEAVRVQLIPADEPGPEPFMESVATVDLDTARDFADQRRDTDREAQTATTGDDTREATAEITRLPGTGSALYGGTVEGVCDRTALVERLQDDDALADAWASGVGVHTADVDEFVGGLAPAVLGNDMIVTNHGWSSGSLTSFVSVLEGGTAVLVDESGVPRVQCSCGNPLAEADVVDNELIRFEGERWDGFSADHLSVVEPDDVPSNELVLSDIETGEEIVEPVGGIALNGYLVFGDSGLSVVDEDGDQTVLVEQAVNTAAPDLAGGVVFTYQSSTGLPDEPDQAHVWHLRAGETEPVPLLESQDIDQEWFELHTTTGFGGRRLVVYEQFDPGEHADQVRGDLYALDMSTRESTLLEEYTSGYEHRVVSVSANDELLQWIGQAHVEQWTDAVDSNLRPVDPPWDPFTGSGECSSESEPCARTLELLGGDDVLAVYPTADSSVVTIALANAGMPENPRWEIAVSGPDSPAHLFKLSTRNGTALMSRHQPLAADEQLNVLLDLDTGEEIGRPDLDGTAVLLTSPIRRPAGSGAAAVPAEEPEGPTTGPPVDELAEPGPPAPQPSCDPGALANAAPNPDRPVEVVDGLCLNGWALINTNPGGEGSPWILARFADGEWESRLAFPAPPGDGCASQMRSEGVPEPILDAVNWTC